MFQFAGFHFDRVGCGVLVAREGIFLGQNDPAYSTVVAADWLNGKQSILGTGVVDKEA